MKFSKQLIFTLLFLLFGSISANGLSQSSPAAIVEPEADQTQEPEVGQTEGQTPEERSQDDDEDENKDENKDGADREDKTTNEVIGDQKENSDAQLQNSNDPDDETAQTPVEPKAPPSSSNPSDNPSDQNANSQGSQVETISVQGSRIQKTEVEDISKIEIPREEAELVAPNGDVAQVPKLLPGTVARANASEVSIRGSDARTSLYYIDDIRVPDLFEPISGTSVLPNRAVSNLEFYPGNFDGEWGNSTGGIIRLETRDEDIIQPYSDIRIKLPTYFSLYHESDVGDFGSMILSARKSTLASFLETLPDDTFEGTVIVPFFQDAYLQYYYGGDTYSIKPRYIHSRTGADVKLPSDETEDNSNTQDFSFRRGYDLVGVDYKTSVHDLALEFSPYFTNSSSNFSIGDIRFKFEGDKISLPLRAQYEISRSVNVFYGVETSFLDFLVDLAVPDTVAADKAEDPFSAPKTAIITEGVQRELATWLSTEFIVGKFTLTPSVRYFTQSDIKEKGFDPRFTSKYRLTPNDAIKFGVGRYSEAPSVERLTEEFGNPDLPWVKSTHYTLGWDTAFGRFTNSLQLFYKEWRDLSRQDQIERFIADTTRTSQGLEWFMRLSDGGPTFGWLAYTFSITKEKRGDFPEISSDDDITHTLHVVGNHKLSDSFQLGARAKYATGYPYTPPGRVFYQATTDVYYPERDENLTNSDRVPDTMSVTLFAQNDIKYESWNLVLRYGVEDYQLQKSSENISYNYDYSEKEFVTGIPAIPFFEVRGTF